MSRQFARAGFGKERTSLYQEITDKIVAELEAGGAVAGVVGIGLA